jgi:hypothetical protein
LILDKKLGGERTHYDKCVYWGMEEALRARLPTFSEMIHYYGPYIGLVLSIIIAIMVLQFVWFKRVVKTKNEEIKRLRKREQQLNDRYLFKIDEEIGYPGKEK